MSRISAILGGLLLSAIALLWLIVPAPLRRLETTQKRVALTFDDGPNPPYTERVLEILNRYQVRATFFLIGRNVEMHRASALRILEAGHEIGNHTYWHGHSRFTSPSRFAEEVTRTDALIRDLGYRGFIPFRTPFGEAWPGPAWALWRAGRTHFLYDVAPIPPDYLHGDPAATARHALRAVRPGSVLLFHDGEGIRAEAVIAVEETVRELVAQGYRLEPVGELFGATKTSALK